ncbi:MAG: sulfatase-like hydrolase/transferase [Bacteroidia bacterium]|nr:sulfatase-like hydrolase/transferase [Bacteroidia bacterium]
MNTKVFNITAFTLTGLSMMGSNASEAQTSKYPNILHIHADDHRPDGLRALGNPLLVTPNLDMLAANGMSFLHCYTMGSMVGAVSTPSRTMLLTGRSWKRIPGAAAATSNAADPKTYLPRVIEAAGYQTWHMGKAGNGFPAGLKEFAKSILDDAGGPTPANDRAHCCQRLADSTILFLKDRKAGNETRPFYIYIAPPVPHDPRSAEPQYKMLYDPATIPLSPAFMPLHPFNNGEMTVRDETLAPWPRTPADTKQQNADYYSCITGFDYNVGRIFDELKASGQWENTIIIFSGDNGLSLGDHGLFGKQNLYEFGGMHVPLVIAGPGIQKGKSEAFVYLMDLYTTFAEFAGATIPNGVEGKSLVPILTGKQTKVRDLLYTGYRTCQRSIRDDRWKLIRYPLINRNQLFDLGADPYELNNLADLPEQKVKVAEMMALLQTEMTSCADKDPLTVSNPGSGVWTPPVTSIKRAPKARAKANRGLIFAIKNGIQIQSANQQAYKIVNTLGQTIAKGILTSNSQDIPISTKGLCIVQINGQSTKVLLTN